MRHLIIVVSVLFITSTSLSAAEFYIDPEAGDSRNDGSVNNPWKSLQEVFDSGFVESREWDQLPFSEESRLVKKNEGAPVKAGDTIWLRSGFYGEFVISGFNNEDFITIAAMPGHKPRFSRISLTACSNFVMKGLDVCAEYATAEKPRTMVALKSHGWHGPISDIVVEDCRIRSAADTSAWSAEDWNDRSCNGIQVDGTRMTVRDNHLKNVNFGISVDAEHSMIESNIVENFAGDGLRGLGDNTVFQYNTVKNCYDVNANHDDGFQSWSTGDQGVGSGRVTGIVLRGNRIINYEDPDQPHRGALQGIGCFDGMYVDWVIENNVVIVDHWHGITLGGAKGCRVVNNTVLDPDDDRPGPAWIRVDKHKNGTPSSNCVIRNNLAPSISTGDGGENMVVDHNLTFNTTDHFFVNADGYDLRLRERSPAIDAGSPKFSPLIDIRQIKRPQGQGVDIGAYEFKQQ
ncbi:MAG: right-handed parallel beta-helix repeat-containing protein [Verrucomicrobia bacterium]|nr:right-handed parallel beta-helix repeat-containing protein [Verrucomicrobiota bacterium]